MSVALLAIDAGVGVALVALIIALAARRTPRRGERMRAVGWVLVAGPLPAAVCLHLAGILSPNVDQIAFLASVVAFAVGAALLLGAAEDDEDWREGSDDSPPWWPEFERELRDYERNRLVRT